MQTSFVRSDFRVVHVSIQREHIQQGRAVIDPYASGVYPQTWLLRLGWRRHGEIDPREVPGPLASS